MWLLRFSKKQLLAITEESVIFLSICKWIGIATAIGVVVGLITTGFLKLIALGLSVTTTYSYYFLGLPVAMFLTRFTKQEAFYSEVRWLK